MQTRTASYSPYVRSKFIINKVPILIMLYYYHKCITVPNTQAQTGTHIGGYIRTAHAQQTVFQVFIYMHNNDGHAVLCARENMSLSIYLFRSLLFCCFRFSAIRLSCC